LCVKLLHCGNNSLANPEDQSQKNIFFMPMGLFALAGALRENGVDVEIINSDLEKGNAIDDILPFAHLDAIGFDCHWVNQSLAVLETAELIKRIKQDVYIFLGGFTASLFAEEILATYPQIDAIIMGDAEVPIVKLCDALGQRLAPDNAATRTRNIQSLNDVPNLIWRGEDDRIRVNDFSYVATAEDMGKLDFAAIDLLRNWEHYRKRSTYWTRSAPFNFSPLNLSPIFFLEIGRGCINRCVFCGGNFDAQRIINNRRNVVFRSVDSVVATVSKAASFGFRTFFSDFEFEGSDAWYIDLFRRLSEQPYDIDFVYSSWSTVSADIVDALAHRFDRAFIQLSPDTADAHLRRKNKGVRAFFTNDELRRCLDYIGTKDNLRVQLYFGYFLAFETSETVLRTMEFIVELILEYPELIEVGYLPFSTDPGSLIYSCPEKYDVDIDVHCFQDYIERIKDTYLGRKAAPPDMRLFKPKGISRGDAVQLEAKVEIFNCLFQSYRQSVSYILRKTRNPDVVMRILDRIEIPGAADILERVKGAVLDVCKAADVKDPYLIETIDREYRMEERPGQEPFKARPHIWLDYQNRMNN
jgi:radical SAM superfamily enzyme YgiQ (UPF0313 family)